jgi:hypothetical protein
MIKMKFHIKGNFLKFKTDLIRMNSLKRSEIRNLGDETLLEMQSTIVKNKVRPQAGEPEDLENNLTVEHFETPDTVGWGVGDISHLESKEETKGWRAVNYGSGHMVGKKMPPYFTPGKTPPTSEKSREGRANPESKGGHGGGVLVTKPIPPMNYIEKTVNYLRGKINRIRLFRLGR